MYIHTCRLCGRKFKGPHKETKFCSRNCYFSTRLGKNNHAWKGGKPFVTQYGYIKVLTPYDHPWRKQSKHNGYYIFEHRLIMEKHLGRYLKPSEFVHHINGIKTDNRIKNLIVITKVKHNVIHFKGVPPPNKGKPRDRSTYKKDKIKGRFLPM